MRSSIFAWFSILNLALYVVTAIIDGFSITTLHLAVFGTASAILSFLYSREGL